MKLKSIVLLAFALGCGLVAMVGVQQALSGNAGGQSTETVTVLFALEDMHAGTKLSEMNVSFKDMPVNTVPEGAIVSMEQYENRAVKSDTYAGEMILETRLGVKGSFGASMGIPVGARLMTVPVDATKSHSGMLQPHDRVDVIISYEADSGTDAGRVKKAGTLLEYIEVYATGANRSIENGDRGEDNTKYVTLIMTPEQSEFVTLAQSKGTISLTMRNKEDKELRQAKGIDDTLLEELSGAMVQRKDIPKSDTVAQERLLVKNQGKNDEESEKDNENEDTPPFAFEVPEPQNIHSFLSNNEETNVENNPVVEEKKEAPKWTVRIFSGDDVIEQQLELPMPEEKETNKKESKKVTFPKPDKTDGMKLNPPVPTTTELTKNTAPSTDGKTVSDFLKSWWKPKSDASL